MSNNSTSSSVPKVTHYGAFRIGDITLECVVLGDGTCGYVKRQFIEAIGFKGKNLSTRFRHFLTETAPNALNLFDKSESPVSMPNGATAVLTLQRHWAIFRLLPQQRESGFAPRLIGASCATTGAFFMPSMVGCARLPQGRPVSYPGSANLVQPAAPSALHQTRRSPILIGVRYEV